MDISIMSERVTDFFQEADRLQWKKNADYHPDKVAMLEILQTAFETNITVEQDLWARIRKQLSALRRFVIEGHVESETPRSRMIDVAVYMGMLAFWTENRKQCVQDVHDFVRDRRTCEDPDKCGHGWPFHNCDRCMFLVWLKERAR